MHNYSLNDIKILQKFGSKDDVAKGMTALKALDLNEIIERTQLSSSKVRDTLSKFIVEELVAYGVKRGHRKTYYITNKGLQKLDELRQR